MNLNSRLYGINHCQRAKSLIFGKPTQRLHAPKLVKNDNLKKIIRINVLKTFDKKNNQKKLLDLISLIKLVVSVTDYKR